MAEVQEERLLRRVRRLEQELEHLKRDLLQRPPGRLVAEAVRKPSLFGSVKGEDVTEEMIEEAKKRLFRKSWNMNRGA